MDAGMQRMLNIAANIAMAVVFFASLIFIGIYGGNYLKESYSSSENGQQEERVSENVAQARSIWGVGLVLFVVLAIVFLVSKIVKKNAS